MTLTELPKYEMFEEGSQIRRSAKSVRSNIVEGYGRRVYVSDYLKHLIYAQASNDETIDHLEILFETVSAFGTVGLSTGVTGWLSEIGKVIISIVMFVGRLGPLVVGVAVSRDTATRYYYAEESIMVG